MSNETDGSQQHKRVEACSQVSAQAHVPARRHNEKRKTHLNIGPHVNKLFGSRTGIFGIPDGGKSNTVAVLLEEPGEYHCPLLVLDTENENVGCHV